MGLETLGCFQFLDRAVNLFWVEAHLKCEKIGGYLAEPHTVKYNTNKIDHHSLCYIHYSWSKKPMQFTTGKQNSCINLLLSTKAQLVFHTGGLF
jgi:hypothetical protein